MLATNYIKSHMKDGDITYNQMAKDLDLTTMTVFNWVRKPHKLNLMKINKLSRVLNVPRERLIEWILDTI